MQKTTKSKTQSEDKKALQEQALKYICDTDTCGNLNDDDIVEIMNQDLFTNSSQAITRPIFEMSETVTALKNIALVMQKKSKLNHNNDILRNNGFDPTLNFRFLNRKFTKNIFLPIIKTRLQWQNGEFPFFKVEARHYNKEKITHTNKRRQTRRIKIFPMKNMVTDTYYKHGFPEDAWAYKGTLYITNLRLFFKTTSNENFNIPFDNVLSYSFYDDCVVIEHLEYNQKSVDVFYVDVDNARLLEIVMQIPL